MKKLFTTVMVLCIVMLSVFSVGAAGISAQEQKVYDGIAADIATAGGNIKLDQKYLNQAENYLLSHELTEAQCNEIVGYTEAVREILKPLNINKLSDIPSASKVALIAEVQKAASVVDAILNVSASNVVTLTDKTTGEVIYQEQISSSTKVIYANGNGGGITGGTTPIKQTDADMTATVFVALILTAVGAFTVIASRKFAASK